MNHGKHPNLWARHSGSHEAMPTRTNADTALTAVWWQLPARAFYNEEWIAYNDFRA